MMQHFQNRIPERQGEYNMKRIVITAVTTFILVSLYGKKATFTYDFTKNKKLCYYADFDIDAAQPDSRDAEYGISQEILDYISENVPNDIMYYCSDPETGEYLYDRIPSMVSEVDAYYAGLTDYCELVEEYHLGKSQHALQQ
jgi:hypothetical protein